LAVNFSGPSKVLLGPRLLQSPSISTLASGFGFTAVGGASVENLTPGHKLPPFLAFARACPKALQEV
ncbi:hypothetical protein P7K49_030309, partial [Saguinus oedipus]